MNRRDRQYLRLLAQGKDNQFIADTLDIQVQSVCNYLSEHLYPKLGVRSRSEAVAWYQGHRRGET